MSLNSLHSTSLYSTIDVHSPKRTSLITRIEVLEHMVIWLNGIGLASKSNERNGQHNKEQGESHVRKLTQY
jgi:hypothetical protein